MRRLSRPAPTRPSVGILLLALLPAGGCATAPERLLDPAGDYATIAESSAWRATSTHAETVALIERLAAESSRIHVESAGTSFEGKDLPLLVVADPPVRRPEDVGDRTVVFAWGGIHSGEVCGKPATLMLARELATDPEPPLLDDLVILLLPLLNADGNDRMSPDNRRNQDGPVEGMGTRPNAQGLNINRDWSKLETPEARAVVDVLNRWDPLVAMDLHTTNGTIHQYTLTYDGPRHPDTDDELEDHTRDVMLPAIGVAMEAATGYKTFSYGNLNRDRTEWRTYPAQPRYSTHYLGLRHVFGILSEAYSYASYEDRVRATLAFVRHTFEYAAANRSRLEGIRSRAIQRTLERGAVPTSRESITLKQRSVLRSDAEPLLGFEGRRWNERGAEATYSVRRDDAAVATETAQLPWAYVFYGHDELVSLLEAHGIVVETAMEDVPATTQQYRIRKGVVRQQREYEGHHLLDLPVEPELVDRTVEAGCRVVRTAQPLGALVAHLLEPRAEDGVGTWELVVPERMVLASEENTAPGGFDADRVGASGLDSGIALPRKRPKQDWGDPELFPVLRLLAPVTIELDR